MIHPGHYVEHAEQVFENGFEHPHQVSLNYLRRHKGEIKPLKHFRFILTKRAGRRRHEQTALNA